MNVVYDTKDWDNGTVTVVVKVDGEVVGGMRLLKKQWEEFIEGHVAEVVENENAS